MKNYEYLHEIQLDHDYEDQFREPTKNELLEEIEYLKQEKKQLEEELELEKQINVEDLKTIDRQQEIIQELRADYGNKAQVERNLLQQENKQLKDNWNKLKEIIDVKLYNMDYLVKLCGYKIDSDTRMILDIIKKEIQELEKGDSND